MSGGWGACSGLGLGDGLLGDGEGGWGRVEGWDGWATCGRERWRGWVDGGAGGRDCESGRLRHRARLGAGLVMGLIILMVLFILVVVLLLRLLVKLLIHVAVILGAGLVNVWG